MAIVGYNKVKHFISKIANIAELEKYGNIFMSFPNSQAKLIRGPNLVIAII
jgi:hypothetical protein